MHTIIANVITGEIVQVPYTAQEEAEWEAMRAAYVPPTAPAAPTKEQLLAQLQALQAQIQALE
jgi:hypothetical protein